MNDTLQQFDALICSGMEYLSIASNAVLQEKINPNKWSKKEILGHLVDSGRYNLQRFTEIQFSPQPYSIHSYQQDACVIANDYQHMELGDLINLWFFINRQIKFIMEQQTDDSLKFQIILPNQNISDLKFLMTDYVSHLEHHMRQILAD